MLPRRVKKAPPAPEPEPDPVEVLQSQIEEQRAQGNLGSRSSDRRTIKKKPAPEPQKKTYATSECETEPARGDSGVGAPEVRPMAPTAFSYFDRLTERSIFDDPLKDFPKLQKH